MVYKDYELAPSNRVLESRSSGSLLDKRKSSAKGNNLLAFTYYHIILIGSFGYFLRKFYIPNRLSYNLFSLVSAGLISSSLASKYEHSAFLFLGDVNEYNYLERKGMNYLFRMAQKDENRNSVTLYS